MSITNDRTVELWQSFMPRRKEINNTTNNDLYSVQIFESENYFDQYMPDVEFEKWAAVEVSSFANIPDEMATLQIQEGVYAVFDYKGPANAALPFFRSIFETWIPSSGYAVDNRPHFTLMGSKYRGNNPDSEEEIWIPVRPTTNTLIDK